MKDGVVNFSFADVLAARLNLFVVRMNYDLCFNDVYLLDFGNIASNHLTKINPILLSKHTKVFQVS